MTFWGFLSVLVVAGLVHSFRDDISRLINKITKIKIPKGIEVILEEVKEKLPVGAYEELKGLTSHDIWALTTVEESKGKPPNTPAMNVALKTLVSVGLVCKEKNQYYLSELGKEILEKAKNILN